MKQDDARPARDEGEQAQDPIAALRVRLMRLSLATEDALTFSEQRRETVLRARAAALAAPAAPTAGADVEETAIRFRLGEECFALPMSFVREVAHLPPLTRLPAVPPFIAGVVHLRGEIVCVYDLHVLFGLALGGFSEGARLLVLGRERVEMAVLCDAVEEEIRITPSALQHLHTEGSASRAYVRGVTADATVVLDGAALLDDPALIVDDPDPRGT